MQITPSSVPILIVAYPLFRTRIQTWRAEKPVPFQQNCRFKNGGVLERERVHKEEKIERASER